MANDTNASNWSPIVPNGVPEHRTINAGTGPDLDPRTLRDQYTESDPKSVFDDFRSTQSSPAGYYPYGIESGTGDMISDPVDRVHTGWVPVVADETNLPQSESNPPMPPDNSMLSRTPGANSPQSIMSKRRSK